MNDRVLLISDDAMMLHDPGPGHPERPARLHAISQMVEGLSIAGIERAKPQAATKAQVERVHDPKYVAFIESLRGKSARLDPDTATAPASVDAAYLAAGAAIDAVDFVLNNDRAAAFAFVRPPGHHAERDRAMGFCLFNNIAVAAAHAIEQHACERVLIVDWDVHHGNGTQHIFESRSDVLYLSTHQWPLYPGTGAAEEVGIGQGEGFTVNVPLPAGIDDAAMLAVYRKLLMPIADSYKPDLVLVSAGFDAHRNDPLGGMRISEAGFAALCGLVCDIAIQHAHGRIALILEGGYNLEALAGSVKACIEILADSSGRSNPALIKPSHSAASTEALIHSIVTLQRRYWPI